MWLLETSVGFARTQRHDAAAGGGGAAAVRTPTRRCLCRRVLRAAQRSGVSVAGQKKEAASKGDDVEPAYDLLPPIGGARGARSDAATRDASGRHERHGQRDERRG